MPQELLQVMCMGNDKRPNGNPKQLVFVQHSPFDNRGVKMVNVQSRHQQAAGLFLQYLLFLPYYVPHHFFYQA
jgi:hypothetical protein